jgi:hypothetical protein
MMEMHPLKLINVFSQKTKDEIPDMRAALIKSASALLNLMLIATGHLKAQKKC